MKNAVSPFTAIAGFVGLWSAQAANLRCAAIRLRSGRLCLYSPVAGFGSEARESLAHLGDVKLLLAPNQYHNKALAEYGTAFPGATLCCAEAAKPRLEKITGLSFEPLDVLAADLPEGMDIITPEGLKTGEIWIRAAVGDALAWIVTDAFSGPKAKIGDYAEEADMLGTFPKYGIGNRMAYRAWLQRELTTAPPSVIVPCHGAMIRGAALKANLLKLIEDRLPS